MNFAKRARARQAYRQYRAGALGSSTNQKNSRKTVNKLHPYLRGDDGAHFESPFDGTGLPSINAKINMVTMGQVLPMAVFNLGYAYKSTFPHTINPQQMNTVTVNGNVIDITMKSTPDDFAHASTMMDGLEIGYSQHGKIFSAVPLKLTITRHFVGNSTSNAFPITSKFGRVTLVSTEGNNDGTAVQTLHVPAGKVVNLGAITQAFVSIPEIGAVNKLTGRVLTPQHLITDRVSILLERK